MSKKGWKAGAVLAAGAGITAVLAAKKRGNMEMDKMKKTSHGSRSDYRNTELGKHDKNSKGIYYTNGNYEAFARPEKPAGIEEKSAYLVGSGLASPGGGMLSRPRCPDAGKEHPHLRGHGYRRRCLRRNR